MNKTFLFFCAILMMAFNTNAQNSDWARIYKAMNKGRKGENLKIGVLGGSITQGYAASTDSKRWANLMTDWWEEQFTDSKVELINAGWGGTGSDIGVHRAFDDLLMENPDYIVIEFSVNDTEGALAYKMMEGLIQQALTATNTPGICLLMLKQDDGTTAQASHKPVAMHYKVPFVSFADQIDSVVAKDGINLPDIFVDGLHPNDVGMAYIAGFIKNQLDSVYSTLPAENELPAISTALPEPLVGTVFSNTYQFFPDNIVPLSKTSWETSKDGWKSDVVGEQIDFKMTGNAVSLIYTQTDDANRGKAEVWVDEGAKTVIDCWMVDDWGTKYAYGLIQEGLTDGEHILHIKVLDGSSASGHSVNIERIMVAGNVATADPIAVTSANQKGVVGYVIEMEASESFDPEGDAIDGYEWTVAQKPSGSSASISKANEANASFIPDVAGEYLISLTVSTANQTSVPATKTLSVRASNAKPVAIAGNDTLSALNKYFRFNGGQSYDDDGDALLYHWELESTPDGSEAELMLPETQKPQIKFDVEGEYVISLVVSDSLEYSDKSYVTVEGKDGYTSITNEKSDLHSIKVFPNPANGIINVAYYMQTPDLLKVQLVALDGKVVHEISKADHQMGLNQVQINVDRSKIKAGVYLINIVGTTYAKTLRTTIL